MTFSWGVQWRYTKLIMKSLFSRSFVVPYYLHRAQQSRKGATKHDEFQPREDLISVIALPSYMCKICRSWTWYWAESHAAEAALDTVLFTSPWEFSLGIVTWADQLDLLIRSDLIKTVDLISQFVSSLCFYSRHLLLHIVFLCSSCWHRTSHFFWVKLDSAASCARSRDLLSV